MNIQQLQYVLAVADLKHFEKAAEQCYVSQSTLSTMIARFEEEIGIKIFERKTKPASITLEGEQVIQQLRIIVKDIDSLDTIVQELKGVTVGELRIAIIPTVAPYLLPLFLATFAKGIPKVKISVQEMTTVDIQAALKSRAIDFGIAAIPLDDPELEELHLYHEPFLIYDCYSKIPVSSISFEELDYAHFWLLQEGHCLRNQVEKICELSNKRQKSSLNFEFKAGSIDSLIRFTRANKGITLLPYMASLDLNAEDKKKIVPLKAPVPLRYIGIVTHKHFVKKGLLTKLQSIIQESVSRYLPSGIEGRMIEPYG
jgi:LysR family transcriptional regulator, hydrogen peroxide-inducible genes activator